MDRYGGGITDVFGGEEEKDGVRSEVTVVPVFVCRRLDTDNSVVKFVESTVTDYDEGSGMCVVTTHHYTVVVVWDDSNRCCVLVCLSCSRQTIPSFSLLNGRNCVRSLDCGLVRVFRILLKRTNLLLSKVFTDVHSG